jgi:hypothetical protein
MQRNALCSQRMAFDLGIKAIADYGRARLTKALY